MIRNPVLGQVYACMGIQPDRTFKKKTKKKKKTKITRDVRNELLIVLQLDIHVGHDKNQYIPV